MHTRKVRLSALSLLCCLAAACSLPAAVGTPTLVLLLPTATVLSPSPSPSPVALLTSVPAGTTPIFPTVAPDPVASQIFVTQSASTVAPPADFCVDAQVTTLINNFRTALQTSNGATLASLVSPAHGMEARLYRNGKVVTYDRQHAKFLFETTYVVNWGPAPGSGLDTKGSFHETIVPALRDVFDRQYTLTCNQVQVGGTTYQAAWPYPGIKFYSVYYPATQANGNMDWHTWLLGMHYVNGKPYLYAIMQFQWEP